MDDMTGCLKELIDSLTPGTVAIIKLTNGSGLKKDKPRDLGEEMDNAEIKSPASGGGYQGGEGV